MLKKAVVRCYLLGVSKKVLLLPLILFITFSIITISYADNDITNVVNLPETPQRIVVFPLFAEEMLLEMVGPDRIVYVGHEYWEGGEAYSPTMELTKQVPGRNWQNTSEEEILALKPDLIIMPEYLSEDFSISFAELKEADIAVLFLKTPETIADIIEALHIVGEAVDEPEKAAIMVQDMEVALAQITEIVSCVPEENRVRVVHYEYLTCYPPGLASFYEADSFYMIADAAGVINTGPENEDCIDLDNNPLLEWNPDLITFDSVIYDTDGSILDIGDSYIENDIASLLYVPEFSTITAIKNRNVYPLRLSVSQFIVQSVTNLAQLAYPELFPVNTD